MSENPPFWRWLNQELVGYMEGFSEFIRGPDFEQIIGFLGVIVFFAISVGIFITGWTDVMRIVLFLLSVLSFIVYKHGVYRAATARS